MNQQQLELEIAASKVLPLDPLTQRVTRSTYREDREGWGQLLCQANSHITSIMNLISQQIAEIGGGYSLSNISSPVVPDEKRMWVIESPDWYTGEYS